MASFNAVDELQGHARQVALDEGHVVGVGLGVQHVAAPQVGPALAQGHQPPQAPHVPGRQAQAVVPAAQHGGQEVKGVVMAAQHHQGAVNVRRRHQQFRGHRPVLLQALAQGRHHQQPVGPHQGGDGPGPPGQRGGDDLVPHPAQGYPDEFRQAGLGRQVLGRMHRQGGPGGQAFPRQAGDEGGGELLEGQHRGHGIARVADDRLALPRPPTPWVCPASWRPRAPALRPGSRWPGRCNPRCPPRTRR